MPEWVPNSQWICEDESSTKPNNFMFRNHIRLFLRLYFIVGMNLKCYLQQYMMQVKEIKTTIGASSILSSSLNSITHLNYFEIIWVRVLSLMVSHHTMENIEQNYLNGLSRWQSKWSNKSSYSFSFIPQQI